ncbi:MAG TPA: hypothetical protein VEB20_01110 [Azospirillaceae bacterium]|nr:hypothetical protein [Azospirillaceae bacterium]
MGFSFFKKSRCEEAVVVGGTYQRVVTGGIVETARILAVTADRMSIPHVRFVVRNNLPEGSVADELRTLSVDSFTRLFSERVPN